MPFESFDSQEFTLVVRTGSGFDLEAFKELLRKHNVEVVKTFPKVHPLEGSRFQVVKEVPCTFETTRFAFTKLDLTHQHLTTIDLSQFPNLETADLSNNDLTVVDLTHNKLRILEMNNNPIETIQGRGKNLVNLKVTHAKSIEAEFDIIGALFLEGVGLVQFKVKADNLLSLFLQKNSLTFLELDFPRLSYLDVTENQLKTFRYRTKGKIPLKTFLFCGNQLETLELFNDQRVGILNVVDQRALDFSHNKIKNASFWTTHSTVWMDHNEIRDEDLEETRGLVGLLQLPNHLSLSNNFITKLPSYLSDLTSLYISNNLITVFGGEGFVFKSLRTLNLFGNPLTLIWGDFPILPELDLTGSPVKTIRGSFPELVVFSGAHQLESLEASMPKVGDWISDTKLHPDERKWASLMFVSDESLRCRFQSNPRLYPRL